MKVTVEEARLVGDKHYHTGKTCKRGHIAPRFTSTSRCTECVYLDNKAKRLANPNYGREAIKKWAKNNPEKRLASQKAWRERNPELWQGVKRTSDAKSRAEKLKRVPRWLTDIQKQEIKDIYLNRPSGYHVDHIVPLLGKNVCGLHVPWNLQYLVARDNLTKSNKHKG